MTIFILYHGRSNLPITALALLWTLAIVCVRL